MRRIALTLAVCSGLSACVTTGGDYPRVRYARAAEAGPVALQLAGRPTEDDMEDAEQRWGRAIAESYACRLNALAVSEAGMVGALELAAMSAASRGRQDPFDGVLGYMSALGRTEVGGANQPDAARCERLEAWIGDVRREGRTLLLHEAEDRLLPPR